MSERDELVGRLRRWGQRQPHGSMERVLFHAAADEIERMVGELERAKAPSLTREAIEDAIGGKLMPWQRRALGD